MGKGGCRHILNAQCSVFMGDKATGAWFDCFECYAELTGTPLDQVIIKSPLSLVCNAQRRGNPGAFLLVLRTAFEDVTSSSVDALRSSCEKRPIFDRTSMTGLDAGKACRKLFQKDLRIFGDDDLECPHCRNRYVVPALTAESALVRESQKATGAAMAAALAEPLELDCDMGFLFEHLVDYRTLPPALREDWRAEHDRPKKRKT